METNGLPLSARPVCDMFGGVLGSRVEPLAVSVRATPAGSHVAFVLVREDAGPMIFFHGGRGVAADAEHAVVSAVSTALVQDAPLAVAAAERWAARPGVEAVVVRDDGRSVRFCGKGDLAAEQDRLVAACEEPGVVTADTAAAHHRVVVLPPHVVAVAVAAGHEALADVDEWCQRMQRLPGRG